ncbi:hypothetical protein ANANG_G00163860 [Anguilla anguilla]|uniref:Dapper homolog 3 n=1 Tax=Anguilla anguilla TaxID=7936 RepID=A0A9D3MAE8_ANGAN|nr:hypothetical protein ANANG_G00163860 [Anguilla anguilla]
MYRALSFPMTAERSRNKERLEASLAGLRELELLKQRQEFLVLRALSLGDATPGHASWGDLQPPRSAPPALNRAQDDLTLRRQLNSLQCASWGLMAELEQQVGELRVEAEPVCDEPPGDKGDSRPSSGFYEPSEVQAAYAGERPKSVGDVFVANRDGLLETGPLSLVPRSFSAPYPSLEGIEEGLGEEEAWVWDPSGPSGPEDEPTAEDYQQARRVHSYILGLIQRRALPQRPCKPRTSLGPDFRAVARQSSLCRKEPELRPAAPEGPRLGLPQPRAGGAVRGPGGAPACALRPPQARLPGGDPVRLAGLPLRSARPRGREGDSPVSTATRRRRTGCRKACRSQSENSLVGASGGRAERKYNTVERDGGGGQPRTRRPPPVGAGCRRWRSTLELSQDEAELPGEQAPRARPASPASRLRTSTATPTAPPPRRTPATWPSTWSAGRRAGRRRATRCRPRWRVRVQPERGRLARLHLALQRLGGERRGLVWPQQLPPQLAPPSVSPPPRPGRSPKAFVKIKASHALKKKILRFRTGSLKVMTTV